MSERVKLLGECKQNKLIPDFLKFRVPNNGKFTKQAIFDFQYKLLKAEFYEAENELVNIKAELEPARKTLQKLAYESNEGMLMLHHMINSIFRLSNKIQRDISERHALKLNKWSIRQDKPLCKIANTVKIIEQVPPLSSFVYKV